MKSTTKKLFALLLAVMMPLSAVSCAIDGESEVTDTSTEAATEATTEYVPDIDVKNYDCEFNIVIGGTYDPDMVVVEENEGDPLGSSIYERAINIKDHLGVTLVIQDAGDWIAYASNVSRTVQAGDDDYQLVLTHVYQGLTDLITSNALYDIGELDAINLDADYWASDLMEEIKVEDKYLLGYNDFCLSNVHCLVFNKDLMARYNLEAPYDLVRNKQWTLDKLMSMASNVAVDNGDNKWDNQDTYGISGWGWVYLISLITSSNMKIVDRNEEGLFEIAYSDNQEKMLNLIDKVFEMYNAEYSYFWKSTEGTNSNVTLNFAEGRSLFQFYSSTGLTSFREEDISFGVLPYPLYDEHQTDYKTLNWNGMMGVPGSIRNPDMVGEVLELLAYYTAPVKVAYYEDLLGAKIADAPDDADMLNVIWDSQVSDVGIIACNSSSSMDAMVYMLPKMCEEGRNNFSSYLKGNLKAAQKGLDRVFKQS